jgi:hypothetical protein
VAILEGEGERYRFDQLLAADAFLLGRKVYEGLASVDVEPKGAPEVVDVVVGGLAAQRLMPPKVPSGVRKEPCGPLARVGSA